MRLSILSLIATIILYTVTLTGSTLAQSTGEGVLLQTEGTLEGDDTTSTSDNSLYDEYSFEAKIGQAVIITVESDEFDTYLLLLNSYGEILAANNDWNGKTNSTIGYELPEDGTYQIRINANESHARGNYKVSVIATNPNNTVVSESIADRLLQQGIHQDRVSQFREALQSLQSALAIYQSIGDRRGEGNTLSSLGNVYLHLSQYQQAIVFFEQALEPYREIEDLAGQGRTLGNLGIVYSQQGQYQQAIEFHKQHLAISRETGDRDEEGDALGNLGIVYSQQGQYQQAIEFYKQHLAIAQETGDRVGEGASLVNSGIAYDSLGQYRKAIELYKQGLVIAQAIGYRGGEARVLGNLGNSYFNLGQFQQAIVSFEQTLELYREIEELAGQGRALSSLGLIYNQLGQHQKAINFHEQHLAITQETGNHAGEGAALSNLSNVYLDLGDHQKALALSKKALGISRKNGNRVNEGYNLGNLGLIYFRMGQNQQAIDLFEQRLAISREIGERWTEGGTQNNLGMVYESLGQYQQAIELYGQALIIAYAIGDQVGGGNVLENLGILFENQEKSELAIAFYKQSINLRKQLSQPLNNPVSRQSYLETIAGTYRSLENLLLEQGRQLEAQQTLELFKLQELSDYANEQGLTTELPDLALIPEEEKVIDTYNRLITVNQQLRACNADTCSNSSELQTAKDRAFEQHQLATDQLTAFIQNDGHKDHPLLRDNFFLVQANRIIAQQPDTVLIYPLVLDESLWLLWVTEEGVNSQRISNVNQQTLTETIAAFRTGLEDRYSDLSDLQTQANQLYNWLISPVEAAVGSSGQLVLALDRNTRYIPIGALYDGQQYLVEKYDISTVLAASLTNTEERAPVGTDNIGILAAGVSKQYENFRALPNVPIELDNIVKDQNNSNDQLGIYSGQQLLDPDFTAQTLQSSLSNDTRFLHIATHGEFVPGNRYSSYLLMGNGEKLPLPEIANLSSVLKGVHLAVLSACQTALGGADEEGLEIAGLGYYFFKSDVDAVMASLWNVNDSSTSQLMQAFYQVLSEGTEANPMTKAEALRIAQLSLLQSNEPGNPDADRFRRIPKNPDDQPRPDSGLAHPYYWAPFILIGNGL